LLIPGTVAVQRATGRIVVRHLRSILYALVLAPAAWILTGIGLTDDLHGRARQYTGVESFTGLLLLLLAGAAYAILVFSPISPAGPALSGLAYLGVVVWALVAPASYAGVWPAGVTKPGFDLSRPGYGLAALLAVPLICTALSARRWARYEPPQLPLIGTLGRSRGAAAVAGTPVAAVTTQILTLPGVGEEGADATQVIRSPVVTGAEPTQIIGVSSSPASPASSASFSEEPTTDVAAAENVGVGDAAADDEPAQIAAKTVDQPEQATEDAATESMSAADEPTLIAMQAVDAPDEVVTEPEEPEEPEAAAEPAQAQTEPELKEAVAEPQPSEAPVEPEPTQAVDKPEPTETVVEPEPAEVAPEPKLEPQPAEAQLDEPTETVEPTDEDATAAQPAAEETEPAAEKPPVGEKTASIPTNDVEKTQVIRLPVGEMPTRDFNVRPGERTQVIPRDRAEETQVIRLPQQRTESADGERTQVIRLGAGTVEPPGDRTQVLRLPTQSPPGEPSTPRQESERQAIRHDEPARPPSIVGAERPDPGADPTTRLVPPQRLTLDEQPGDETTVDVGNGQRAMTVMNLERPAGELAADDTRPLTLPPIPPERRQDDDQTT
jgi:hypothetical protein